MRSHKRNLLPRICNTFDTLTYMSGFIPGIHGAIKFGFVFTILSTSPPLSPDCPSAHFRFDTGSKLFVAHFQTRSPATSKCCRCCGYRSHFHNDPVTAVFGHNGVSHKHLDPDKSMMVPRSYLALTKISTRAYVYSAHGVVWTVWLFHLLSFLVNGIDDKLW
jgi:hypothetical protein